MNTKTILLAVIFFTISIASNAQANKTQKERVKQGAKSSEITKAEADKIREQRKDVKAEVKEAKADGTITKEEKKDINKERKEANKAIVRAKKNKKTRN
jgi:uncharacterized membrane protein YebE (DUF533 family)